MDGEAHVTYEIQSNNSITYKGSTKAVKKKCKTDVDLVERGISAEVRAIVSSDLALRAFWGISVVDVGFGIGAGGTGSMIERANGMVCNDLYLYKYLAVHFGENTDYLKKLGVNKTWTIWDKGLRGSTLYKGHTEDGAEVPKCTWKGVHGKVEDKSTVPGGYMVEYEDEGFGTKLELLETPESGTLGFGHLKHDFYIYPGNSITIRPGDEYGANIDYCTECGTITKRIGEDYEGRLETVLCCGSVSGWLDQGVTLEVLAGRVTVFGVGSLGGTTPMVTLGKCDALPYPLRISASDLVMEQGSTYQLNYENDFASINDNLSKYESPYDKDDFYWTSDDPYVALVNRDTGFIEAGDPGTTVVRCHARAFERYCIVTVK